MLRFLFAFIISALTFNAVSQDSEFLSISQLKQHLQTEKGNLIMSWETTLDQANDSLFVIYKYLDKVEIDAYISSIKNITFKYYDSFHGFNSGIKCKTTEPCLMHLVEVNSTYPRIKLKSKQKVELINYFNNYWYIKAKNYTGYLNEKYIISNAESELLKSQQQSFYHNIDSIQKNYKSIALQRQLVLNQTKIKAEKEDSICNSYRKILNEKSSNMVWFNGVKEPTVFYYKSKKNGMVQFYYRVTDKQFEIITDSLKNINQDNLIELTKKSKSQFTKSRKWDTKSNHTYSYSIENKLMSFAQKSYPNDYSMQQYIYKKQLAAYNYMQVVEDYEVLQIATKQYPNDYSMQQYIYDKQLASKHFMSKVSNYQAKKKAISRYPNDYSMQQYIYEQNAY